MVPMAGHAPIKQRASRWLRMPSLLLAVALCAGEVSWFTATQLSTTLASLLQPADFEKLWVDNRHVLQN